MLNESYVHGPSVDEPWVWYEGTSVTSTARRFLHPDHQGSIVSVSDNAGALINANAYDPYGVPASSNLGRFQYTGQVWLPELALYHYKARAYSATLGRFLQTDPVGYQDGLNWYAYVGNDPFNRTDPTGALTCNSNDKYLCQTVTEDAQQASLRLRVAAQRLMAAARGPQSAQTRNTRRQFERVYGEGSATRRNLERVAGAASQAADWLDSPDTQAVLGGRGDGITQAEVSGVDDRTVTIYDRYFGFRGRENSAFTRSGILTHESGHGVGMPGHRPFVIRGEWPPYPGAVRARGIEAFRRAYGTEALLNEADALRCAVQAMSSTCP